MNIHDSDAKLNLDDVFRDIYLRGDQLGTWMITGHLTFAFVLASYYATWSMVLLIGVPTFLMVIGTSRLMPASYLSRAVVGVGLQTFCALHIYQMHGLAEMHFFFFTSVTVMIIYQDVAAIIPGVAAIVAQHILFALLTNSGVNMYFFPERHVTIFKLATHFGIAVVQVGIAYFAIIGLRAHTIKQFETSRKLLDARKVFERVFQKLEHTVASLSASAQQLTTTTDSLNSEAQEQNTGVQRTSASLEQMSASMDEIASNSRLAASLSADAQTAARLGNSAVLESASAIQKLDDMSGQISSLVDALNEIAFQTHMLSINAAIQAATAGDYGRSFAVVSSEVRNLASRSAKTATDARGLITGSIATIRRSAELASRSGTALSEIVTGTSKVLSSVGHISTATQEQSQAVQEIARAMSSIDRSLGNSTDQTASVLRIAKTLTIDSADLRDLLGQISKPEPNAAVRRTL